ncbi:hypothetical protein ACLOAV_003289 [Pseudogymnoascus australis]
MAAANVESAIALIDEAHSEDPNVVTVNGKEIPYELHYAQKSTHYLGLREPDASPVLRTAVRAQHFRRWEVPRTSYPATRVGYFAWRTSLKKRQADLAAEICTRCNYSAEEAEAVAALIRKEDMKSNVESQILEDVACLVFLDDQFEKFEKEHDEEKIVNILKKTWAKMSEGGQKLALEMELSDRAKELVGKALS